MTTERRRRRTGLSRAEAQQVADERERRRAEEYERYFNSAMALPTAVPRSASQVARNALRETGHRSVEEVRAALARHGSTMSPIARRIFERAIQLGGPSGVQAEDAVDRAATRPSATAARPLAAFKYSEVPEGTLDAMLPSPRRSLAGLTWLTNWAEWATWSLNASAHQLGVEPPRLRWCRPASGSDAVAFSSAIEIAGSHQRGSREIWVNVAHVQQHRDPHQLAATIGHEVHHHARSTQCSPDEVEALAEAFGSEMRHQAHGLYC